MVLTEALVIEALIEESKLPRIPSSYAIAYQFQRTLTVQTFISSLLEFAGWR